MGLSLYALLVVGILYAIFRFNVRQAKLKASLEYERKEKEYIEELNQTKLRFFTNISHEFRTLLTLIIVQVELLLQLNKLNPSVYNRVLKIYKNARHMLMIWCQSYLFSKTRTRIPEAESGIYGYCIFH